MLRNRRCANQFPSDGLGVLPKRISQLFREHCDFFIVAGKYQAGTQVPDVILCSHAARGTRAFL